MNKRILILIGIVVCVCFLLTVGWHYIVPRNGGLATGDKASPTQSLGGIASIGADMPPQTTSNRQQQEGAMSHFLLSLKDGLKKAGIQEAPPVADQLRKAVASKDHGEIIRAFHDAIYGPFQKMSEVVPLLKGYLLNEDPFVRYTAAQTLYTAGDRAGYDTLLSMVAAVDPILSDKLDLRIEAAKVLAKFRETTAASSIFELYQRTSGPGLLSALAKLNGPEIAAELQRRGYNSNKYSIVRYGMLEAPDFTTQLTTTFREVEDPDIKAAAAWALARLGHDDYTKYLMQMAQEAIDANPKSGGKFDSNSDSLRYLETVMHF